MPRTLGWVGGVGVAPRMGAYLRSGAWHMNVVGNLSVKDSLDLQPCTHPRGGREDSLDSVPASGEDSELDSVSLVRYTPDGHRPDRFVSEHSARRGKHRVLPDAVSAERDNTLRIRRALVYSRCDNTTVLSDGSSVSPHHRGIRSPEMTRHSLLAGFTELTLVIGRFNGCGSRTEAPPGTPGGDKCEDVGGWGLGGLGWHPRWVHLYVQAVGI